MANWPKTENQGFNYLTKLAYPNGVEFEFTQDEMEGVVMVRCVTCSHLGVSWKSVMTESFMAVEVDPISQLKHQLVEHANQHNELVQKLVEKLVYLTEKYGLDKIKPAPASSKALPPEEAFLQALEFGDEGFWAKEMAEAVKKFHPSDIKIDTTTYAAKGLEKMFKAAMESPFEPKEQMFFKAGDLQKEEPKDDVKSGRRISLEDEEE